MKKGNIKLFNKKENLYELVNLRLNGYALTSLATLFNCHYTSLRYHFDKYQISPEGEVYAIERIASNVLPHPPSPQWKIVNGERINLGKNYKEYLVK